MQRRLFAEARARSMNVDMEVQANVQAALAAFQQHQQQASYHAAAGAANVAGGRSAEDVLEGDEEDF